MWCLRKMCADPTLRLDNSVEMNSMCNLCHRASLLSNSSMSQTFAIGQLINAQTVMIQTFLEFFYVWFKFQHCSFLFVIVIIFCFRFHSWKLSSLVSDLHFIPLFFARQFFWQRVQQFKNNISSARNFSCISSSTSYNIIKYSEDLRKSLNVRGKEAKQWILPAIKKNPIWFYKGYYNVGRNTSEKHCQ